MKLNAGKSAALFVSMLSIILLTAQGISNNHSNFMAEGSAWSNEVPKVIGVQDNSQNGGEDDKSEDGANNLPDTGNQGETGGEVTDGLTGNTNQTLQTQGEMTNQSGSQIGSQMTNQSGSQMTNQNVDQTTNQSGSQMTNQNVDQTTNQNVSQTTDQNVNVQTKQKLDLILVEEGGTSITVEEQNRIEAADKILVTQHTVVSDPACRTGNILAGVSNAQDLRILLNCQDAIGTVVHTNKLDNGHFVFFLDLDDQYKFLLNEKNNEETAGLLVVEIVPQDQTIPGVFLPVDGDRVHVWGAWVTDKPKGWHEITPAWKVISQ